MPGAMRGEGDASISMTWPQYLRRECTYRGRVVRLGRIETEVVSALLVRRGEHIATREMIEAVYDDPFDSPEYERDVIMHAFCRVRRKMPDAITNIPWRGYTIDLPAEPLAEAA